MTTSRAARLRRLWLDVHLWIGVGLLLVLIPLGVSGSILVWHDGLDRAMHADRYAVSGPEAALAVGDYARAAQEAFGAKASLSQLRLPQEPGDPVVAVGRIVGESGPGGRPRSLNAWIDPPTGRVLAVEDVGRSFTSLMHRLHGTLLIPQIGRKVVGWLGWAMFVSCATGLWLWWPRNGAVLKALRWRRGPSALFNLHHMLGFWICLPLAVLSLTGIYISFPQTSRALFGVAEASRAASGPARGGPGGGFATPLDEPRLGVDPAIDAARALAPGAEPAAISLPTRGREPAWKVQLRPGAGGRPISVEVVDATGAARLTKERPRGAQDPVSRWMRRIHDGADVGLAWQAIIFVGGLAPAVLGVSGLVMWLRRRARRRSMAQRLKAA